MKNKFKVMLGFILILGLLFVSCSQPAPTPKQTPSPTPSPTSTLKSPTVTLSPSPKPAQVKEWISQTAGETTYGYLVGAALSRVANQALEKTGIALRIKNVVGPGSTVNFRSFDKGETDMFYMNTPAQLQAWTNTGAYEKDPLKHKTYQGVYTFSSEVLALIRTDSKDKIKSYADFAGKKVFPQPLGSAGYEAVKAAFGALDIWNKIDPKPMNYDQLAGSLQLGSVEVVMPATTCGGRGVAAWIQELIRTANVSVVNPTDKEKETITTNVKWLNGTTYPASLLFGTKNAGVTDIWGSTMFQGWNFPSYGTTDEVYIIVKAWYEHPDDLIAMDAGFKQFAETGLKFNTQVLDSLAGIPVHPGVAKYYKERGIWKDAWKVGEVQPKTW